jgi:hypothetical protein
MSGKLNELLSEASRLKSILKSFYDEVYEVENGWTDVYARNADDQYARNQLYKAAELLRQAHGELDALLSPVAAEGTLGRNSNGRFTLGVRELTSGDPVEYLELDDFDDTEIWRRGRIEHYDGDYRIWKRPDIALEGLRVRVKA